MINGLPYVEAFMAGALVMFVAFRILIGREAFMSIFFGEDPKTKKEPLQEATKRDYRRYYTR